MLPGSKETVLVTQLPERKVSTPKAMATRDDSDDENLRPGIPS